MSRKRSVIVVLALAWVIVGAGIVYALTSIQQNNNVTITPGIGIGLFTSLTSLTSCPSLGSPSYSVTSPYTNSVNWTIPAGGSQTQYYCIQNEGSGNDPTPTIILSNGKPVGLSCSETQCLSLTVTPSTIPALAAQSVSAPITIILSSVPDASGSATAVIVVS